MPDRMDVPFTQAGGRDLRLDVYAAAPDDDQRTAVVLVHGGGWRRGDRKQVAPHGQLLGGAGFTAIASEYRLLGESPYPAALEDVKAAVRWTRANADELGVDPDRIVLQGHSAGGQLVLVAAGTAEPEEAVAAVAAFYAPTTFHVGDTRGHGTLAATGLLGQGADEAGARAASPLTYVSPDFPPTFLLTGGDDHIVPPSASLVMYDALRRAGVETDLHILGGQVHGFDRVEALRPVVSNEVAAFFKRTVSQREAIGEQIDAVKAYMAQLVTEARAGAPA